MSDLNDKNKKRETKPISRKAALPEGEAMGLGRIPPQALNLEEAVLGAMLIDKDGITIVLDILREESFYKETHGLIYAAMCRLFEKTFPIDLLTVTEELKKSGDLEKVGGEYTLIQLSNRVASAANIEFHARIIAQKHILRELIRVSGEIAGGAFEETTDVFNLLDFAEQSLFSIADKNMGRSTKSMGELLMKAVKQIEELNEREEGLTGVPAGFVDLDRITGGWQRSDLIIVAARPGMGKTSMTLAIARNASMDYSKGVAFFSLEMSSLQLVNRLLAMETEISSDKLRRGQLTDADWDSLNRHVTRMSEVKLYIDDTPGISIFELRAKCRRLKLKHDIQLIIIDYLQLMQSSGDSGRGNREQEIAQISRALKSLAKELDVPVIALSQLSRAVETRGGAKRPQLSDLRESGSIEQDADIVSFIYRPEYYGILEDEKGNSLKGIAEFIIAKHRNGALDTVQLRWDERFAKFSDLESNDELYLGERLDSILNNSGYLPTNDRRHEDPLPF